MATRVISIVRGIAVHVVPRAAIYLLGDFDIPVRPLGFSSPTTVFWG